MKIRLKVSSDKDKNLNKLLEKGLDSISNTVKTGLLKFTKRYQLIGLKGLGTADGINSLGAFVFDTNCDINEPNGIGLAAKEAAKTKPKPTPESVKEKENVTYPDNGLQQTAITAIWVSFLVIFLVIILVAITIAVCVHRRRAIMIKKKVVDQTDSKDNSHLLAEQESVKIKPESVDDIE